jgi:hypothetical protein
VSGLNVGSVIRQAALFGKMAAKAKTIGDDSEVDYVEKQFEEFLKFFPMELIQTQMPEYFHQIAVQAYMAAYIKEI